MKTIVLCAFFLLAACGESEYGPDQCLRQTLFATCMAALPKGPERTATSNDWDEVVDACERASSRQSLRLTRQIKPECRGRFF